MTGKQKVYILGDYRPGLADGLAEFSYQNASLLREELDIHFLEFDNSNPDPYFDSSRFDGITIFRFGSKNVGPLSLPSGFKEFLKSLPAKGSVFHLNHIYNVRNYLVARKLVKYQLPYIITPHDSYVYGNEFRRSRPLPERTYRDIFVRVFDKYVLDHAAVCHALTDQCIPSLRKLTQVPVKVVHNQIADIKVPFQPDKIEDQICFVGRFDISLKGIDRAVAGFRRFQNSYSSYSHVKLILVGPLKDSLEQTQETLFRDFPAGPGDRVLITGRVDENKRNDILMRSKVYLHMSRFEGFALSVIQALSAYTPVIISRQVPTKNIIAKYKAGIVVDTEEELSMALFRVFSMEPDEYEAFCRRARECYEKEFQSGVIKPQLLDLYQNV